MSKSGTPKVEHYIKEPDRSMLSRLHAKGGTPKPGSLPAGTRFAFRSDGTCYPVAPIDIFGAGPGKPDGPDDVSEGTFYDISATYHPVFNYKTKRLHIDPEPLKIGERGLVLMPPMRFENGNVRLQKQINRQELRLALLLWDRIESPTTSGLIANIGDEANYLLSEGIAQRSHVKFSLSSNTINDVLDGVLSVFTALDAREPGQWSLARGDKSLSFSAAEAKPERGLLLSLYQAIPVPDGDAPIEEILAFKEKRRSELMALRFHLEDLYKAITSAPDRELAQASEMAKLDASISSLVKVSREAPINFRLSDIKAKIDWPTWIAGSGAFVKASDAGLGITNSALLGIAAAASVSLRLDIGMNKKSSNSNPYEYIARFNNDLAWHK